MAVNRKVTVPKGIVFCLFVDAYSDLGVRVIEAMNQRGARELKLPVSSISGLQSSGLSALQGIIA